MKYLGFIKCETNYESVLAANAVDYCLCQFSYNNIHFRKRKLHILNILQRTKKVLFSPVDM